MDDRNPVQPEPLRPSSLVMAVGAEHVRLMYHFLDRGDLDACASLLDEQVRFESPGKATVHGRTAVDRVRRELLGDGLPHHIERLVVRGARVVAVGRLAPVGRREPVRFVDVLTLSPHAMVRGCTRYYRAPPR
ncbi:nuclear transport factor 2 family protein [Streptomyces sp. NPDC033538]|uniref:nuclear transport factor 2 family protein n=1 Tax=Streptomyces sp. NPDC033538 TaxID=3155367 RepID=UPI00340BE505